MRISKTLSAAVAVSMAIGTGALFPATVHAEPYNWDNMPEWIPADFESAMEFRNSYGVTHNDDYMICIVEKVDDGNEMYCDIQAYGTDRPDDVIGAGYQAKKFVYEYKLPEEPDKSNAKEYALYEDMMRRLEYTSIPEQGTGYHYEALVIYADDEKNIDVEVGITEKGSATKPEQTYTYSFSHERNTISETDIYGWLPDCVPEHNKYVEEYGNISYRDGMLIHCDDVNGSTGARLSVEYSGEGKVRTLPYGRIIKEYLIQPTGSTSFFATVYTGETPGNVDITFTKGRPWDTDADDHKVTTASFVVADDLTIREGNNAPPEKKVPEWIPQDMDSLNEFIKKHGDSWIEDGIICCVRQVYSDRKQDYFFSYGGSAAEKIKDYTIYENSIGGTEDGYYNEYMVVACDIPESSDITINYDFGRNSQNIRTVKSFTFEKDSTGYITEKDMYSWLPDGEEEFEAYYAKHGTYSIQAGYVMYCTDMASGAASELQFRQAGTGRFIEYHQERITANSSNDGGTEHIIRLYKPVQEGNAEIELYQTTYNFNARKYETVMSDKAYFSIGKDMTITPAEKDDIKTTVKGDCNGDGSVGLSDVVTLQNWLHGKDVISGSNLADANGDGVVDVFDLIVLKKKVIASLSEAPRPVMAIISENYAWGAHQSVEIYDQYGNCYNYDYSSGNRDYSDYSEGIITLRMSQDNWYDKVREIMEKGSENPASVSSTNIKEEKTMTYSKNAGVLPDGAVKEINKFSENAEKYSKEKMYSEGMACDYGEISLYIINAVNEEKPVFAKLAEYGDSSGWIETEECKNFIKSLAGYGIYGSNLIDSLERTKPY